MKVIGVGLVVLMFTPLLAGQQPACPPASSHISMPAGTFSPQPGVTFRLRHFVATLVPMGKSAPSCFQKMTVVSHAEIFVSNASLTEVFSQKLEATNSKIHGFKVENGMEKVTISGEIVKVIPIRFSIEGPVATNGQALLLNANKVKADGIPVKLLMNMIGEHLSSLMAFKGVNGVSVDGNTISFFPEQIAHLKGRIESVQSTPEGLTLRYGRAPARTAKLTVE